MIFDPAASGLLDSWRGKPALTARSALDELEFDELELDLENAPVGDETLVSLVGEPELMAPADTAPAATVTNLRPPRLGPDGQEQMLTLPSPFDAPPVDEDDVSPTGDLEIAPTAVVESAPASDAAAAAPDAASAMRAMGAFFGGRAGQVEAVDAFSFGALAVADGEAASAELDPFMDAVDPAWMGEVMATLLIDAGLSFELPADGPAPTVEIPLDGVDGWVV